MTDVNVIQSAVTKELQIGAEGGIRTLTGLLPTDFKSVASAISPPRLRACSQDSIDRGCVHLAIFVCDLPLNGDCAAACLLIYRLRRLHRRKELATKRHKKRKMKKAKSHKSKAQRTHFFASCVA